MEKIIDAFIDEVVKRVLAKLGEDTSSMHNFLELKVKASNVEGLEEFIGRNISADDVSGLADAIDERCEHMLRNAKFDIDVSV